MNFNTRHNLYSIVAGAIILGSCQKLTHPALGDYPKDTNPPGGPLKFYAAFEGTSVDSIRANFGNDNNVSYVSGIQGKGVHFAPSPTNGTITYGKPNDFGMATNFSVAFWINAGTIAMKDHNNADGIFAFAKTSDFWGNMTVFADHETSNSDSMRLTIVLGGPTGSHFITHDNNNRLPHMYDGNWHHLAITYEASSSNFMLYLDGKQFEQKTVAGIAFSDPSVLVLGNFEQSANIQGKSSDNAWQSSFPGTLDQFRMYGSVLSPGDIASLFANKM